MVGDRDGAGPAGGIDGVLDRMRAIDGALPGRDGAAVFNRMYLAVTEDVAASLTRPGIFADPAFMHRLDVVFAGRWLEAYDAAARAATSGRVPRAWAPLFECRDDPGVLPVQFALAGMNTHIAHDLPLAVVRTCVDLATEPGAPGVRADYEAVNALLAAREAAVRRSFLSTHGLALDRLVGPAAHLLASWKIDKARDAAWVHAETLWALRHTTALAARYRRTLARSVGLVSRLLLTPVVDPAVAPRR